MTPFNCVSPIQIGVESSSSPARGRAHAQPTAHFARKIFLSAKIRQFTPAGEEKQEDFMLPN